MAKPIFLIGFPMSADNESVYHVQADLAQKLKGEYHVIAYKILGIESIKFEVLNAINATDVEIKDLIAKTNEFVNQVLLETNEFLQAFNENNITEDGTND